MTEELPVLPLSDPSRWLKEWRLRFFHKTRIPVFFGYGEWWCPFLPRRDKPLHTVITKAMDLPQIDNPTEADVAKYHQIYVEKLVDLFERNKARYGYGDRTLNVY